MISLPTSSLTLAPVPTPVVDVTLTDIVSSSAGRCGCDERGSNWRLPNDGSKTTICCPDEMGERLRQKSIVRQEELTYNANGVPTNAIIYNQRLANEGPLDEEETLAMSDPLNDGNINI